MISSRIFYIRASDTSTPTTVLKKPEHELQYLYVRKDRRLRGDASKISSNSVRGHITLGGYDLLQ